MYEWRFFRAGGLDQVLIETSDDLRNLRSLDRKLWVALSCPTRGMEIEGRTLDLIDTDGDGRIRPPELIGAVDWAVALLKDPASMLVHADALPLAAIDDSTSTGKSVLLGARRVLANLGKSNAVAISVADASDTVAIFATTRFNGDGVIPADAAEDDDSKALIELIISTHAADVDRSGKVGVNQARVDAFYADLQAFADWWTTGEAGALALGDATPAAHEALLAARAKVDDYFARCRIAAFDGRAAEALNRSADTYAALAVQDLSTLGADVAGLPLQLVAPGRALDLAIGVNPAWSDVLSALRDAVVVPLLGAGATTLDEAAWEKVKAAMAPYEAWLRSKAGGPVEGLGVARVRELLAGDGKARLTALIERDVALAPELVALQDVEKLVRFHRDLGVLVRNFVNFAAFYDRSTQAVFQAGTLYLDERACALCVRVDDVGGHAAVAGMAKMCLAYCHLTRLSGESMHIVAAFTQGDSDYLMVGRRGVFYDRKGVDWDAEITKLIENPISIQQAFWTPYKKVVSLIETQIEKFASAEDAKVHDQAAAHVVGAADQVKAAAPPSVPFDIAKFAGIFGVIGLALGTIGAMLTAAVTGFLQLPIYLMPLALGGLMLVISGPSMLIAGLKLRQRTIGPLLEGNGWAINGRIAMNIPMGTTFTDIKALPPGAGWSLEDPFMDRAARRRNRWITVLVLVAMALVGWFWVKPTYFDPKPEPAAPAAPAEAPAAPAAAAPAPAPAPAAPPAPPAPAPAEAPPSASVPGPTP